MYCYLLVDEDDVLQVISDKMLSPDDLDKLRKDEKMPYAKAILLTGGALSMSGDVTAWLCSPAGHESDEEFRRVYI